MSTKTEQSTLLVFCITLLFANCSYAQTDSPPARTEDNLIVAAYNIQFFGDRKHDLAKLAEVIQHFDVCGIIELHDEMELPKLVRVLNDNTDKNWGFTFGVRTHRPGGRYKEAYGVVWRTDRVQLQGLVGGFWDLEEAFRNDPYWVSFKRKKFDFTMGLLHTRWSNDAEGSRAEEVGMLAEHVNWVQDFLDERDIFLVGDFNYAGASKYMKPLTEEAGMIQLDKDPKSTFKSDGSGFASSYDHIYALDGQSDEFTGQCNTTDVCKLVYGDNSVANMKKTRKELSDHLPVFAVFNVSGVDDD